MSHMYKVNDKKGKIEKCHVSFGHARGWRVDTEQQACSQSILGQIARGSAQQQVIVIMFGVYLEGSL